MKDLENIEVGDAVALVHRKGWSGRLSLTKGSVERVTKTQVTAIGGRRFNKRGGIEIGSGSGRFRAPARLCRLTPELIDEARDDARKSLAEKKCRQAAELLHKARGDEAVKLADIMPEEYADHGECTG